MCCQLSFCYQTKIGSMNSQQRTKHFYSLRTAVLALSLVFLFGFSAFARAALVPFTGASVVASGQSHTCALMTDATVRCWGDNRHAQLGNGVRGYSSVLDQSSRSTPVAVKGLTDVTAVSAGASHTCAIRRDGTVYCWGDGYFGSPIGDGPNVDAPQQLNGITDAAAISSGGYHTCVVHQNGLVSCWGRNNSGQLGDGTRLDNFDPVNAEGPTDVASISSGFAHTCALTKRGALWCWGISLANGTASDQNKPVLVSGLDKIQQISSGQYHTCALLTDSTVRCWGNNASGQLGDGTKTNSAVPVTIPGLSNVNILAAGGRGDWGGAYTCAVMRDATVQCWGDNLSFSLGDGTRTPSLVPKVVPGLSMVAAMSAGASHACAVLADTTVRCWGENYAGQTGNSGVSFSTYPLSVSGVSNARTIAIGGGQGCALLNDETVKCWGANDSGQLGDSTFEDRAVAVQVRGLSGVIAIATGGHNSCALLTSGTARCWGGNPTGQLGNNAQGAPSAIPVDVVGLTNAKAIAVGTSHSCALKNDGTVECWGDDGEGQLGDGGWTRSLVPIDVPGLTNAVDIVAGAGYSCALLTDATVSCWGYDRETQQYHRTPYSMPGLIGVSAITAGSNRQTNLIGSSWCVIFTDGRVQCSGTSTSHEIPSAAGAVMAAAGASHACALTPRGTTQCWGANDAGQIGSSLWGSYDSALPITGLSSVRAVGAGASHSCALLQNGTVQCWGDNSSSQLGNISLSASSTPTTVLVSDFNLNQRALAGAWYDPAKSGQGLLLDVFPNLIAKNQGLAFAGWFTFDSAPAGGPEAQRWYTLQGNFGNFDPVMSLKIYKGATSGNFNAPPTPAVVAVGDATVRFMDCGHGVLTYAFSDGSFRSGSIPLTRLTSATACSHSGDDGAAPPAYLSGTWYSPETSGQGLMLNTNSEQNLLFGGWYTFAKNGTQLPTNKSQRWYTLQSAQYLPGVGVFDAIPIYSASGGIFSDPTPIHADQVGSAQIKVQGCSSAILSYRFTAGENQGLSGNINLQRLGPVSPGCNP